MWTYDGSKSRGSWAILLMAATAAALLLLDIAEDLQRGALRRHVALEGFAALLLALVVLRLGLQLIQVRRQSTQWRASAEKAHADAAAWQSMAQQTLRNWHAQVHTQMDTWGLTAAEQDVALGVLQGKSFKELAQLRGVSERTVRQQAGEIYRKSGLRSRSEFAAFFLTAPAKPDV